MVHIVSESHHLPSCFMVFIIVMIVSDTYWKYFTNLHEKKIPWMFEEIKGTQ